MSARGTNCAAELRCSSTIRWCTACSAPPDQGAAAAGGGGAVGRLARRGEGRDAFAAGKIIELTRPQSAHKDDPRKGSLSRVQVDSTSALGCAILLRADGGLPQPPPAQRLLHSVGGALRVVRSAAPEPLRRRRRLLQPARAAGGVRVGGVLARLLRPPIPPRHRPVLDVGESPAPDASRCLSRCADTGVLRHGGGLRCGADPRERELADFAALGSASPLRQLRLWLQPRAAAPERRPMRRTGAVAARAAAAAAAAGRRGLRRAARSVGVDASGARPQRPVAPRPQAGTPGMRSVKASSRSTRPARVPSAALAAARLRPAALGGGARRARARPAASPCRSSGRACSTGGRSSSRLTREIGEAHAVVVRVGSAARSRWRLASTICFRRRRCT